MKIMFLGLLIGASAAYAQTKGFVLSNVQVYVSRCQDSQTPIQACKAFDEGIWIAGERIEPLRPGNYVYYTTAALIPKTFSISLSQKTNLHVETYSTLDLYKLAPHFKNYGTSDYDSDYWFTISPDFNDPQNRSRIENQVRETFKAVLNSRKKVFCDSTLTVAQAISRNSVEICLGTKRRTIPVAKLDRETERRLDLLMMNPSDGYYVNDFSATGRTGKLILSSIFTDTKDNEIYESDFESIQSLKLYSYIFDDQPSSTLYEVKKDSDLKDKTIALFPGKYIISIHKRSSDAKLTNELVDVIPFQIK